MRGYPERTLATRAKWLLDTRKDVEVSATEWVEEMEAVLKELANAPEPAPVGEAVNVNGWEIVLWKGKESDFPVGTKFYAIPPANNQSEQHLEMVNLPAPSVPDADLVRDAERYRWLRDTSTDVATVIDKKVGWREYDEQTKTGGYGVYEYRCGDELDAAIDAAIEREKKGGAA